MHKPSIRAKKVWQRLIEWYGVRFAEQYGHEPTEDWCDVVDRTDNAQVARGMNLMRVKYIQHPPTFPQFAEAMSPVMPEKGPHLTTVEERLAAFVVARYWSRLTERQQRGPWTYTGRFFDSPGVDGKLRENHGTEITGVLIEADGDHPALRVNVLDMQAAFADQMEVA